MPTEVDREQLRQLLDVGAQLVEVLPQPEYEDEHLPNAICRPSDRLQDVCEQLDESGWDTCFVLDECFLASATT